MGGDLSTTWKRLAGRFRCCKVEEVQEPKKCQDPSRRFSAAQSLSIIIVAVPAAVGVIVASCTLAIVGCVFAMVKP